MNELVNRVSISRTGQRRHCRTTDSHCRHLSIDRRAGLRVFSDLATVTPLPLSQCNCRNDKEWPKTMQTKRRTMIVTKGGLEAITRSPAMEYAQEGIRFNAAA